MSDAFLKRHLGIKEDEEGSLLEPLGFKNLDQFIDSCLPEKIRLKEDLALSSFPSPLTEYAALQKLRSIAEKNIEFRSLIGMGYYGTDTPSVVRRLILENPGWYTQYTPYQPEISQGRLEALLNFQTVVADLTGFSISNASLLDEATAAAEALTMCLNLSEKSANRIFVSESCHPQTIGVVKTRASALGLEVVVGGLNEFDENFVALLVQYPDTTGEVTDFRGVIAKAKESKTFVVMAADILALTLLTPPAELGADIAIGSTQRFGVPLGFGGPHAAYLATKDEYKRIMPGRLVGVSKDSSGKRALRLALQTREQHIRREKATSNICTAQVLLAVMAGMYAVYHGPNGLKAIAQRINSFTALFAKVLRDKGFKIVNENFFDTLTIDVADGASEIIRRAEADRINLRNFGDGRIAVSLDELTTIEEVQRLIKIFIPQFVESQSIATDRRLNHLPNELIRRSSYLTHPVFNSYHSETEFMRYVKKLESKDLSLTASMIPLGSCTMKLNAASEMYPVSWPEFANLHPFAPEDQSEGYKILFRDLERSLGEITGFHSVSLQPNAGSQGEYAGLLAIRGYHESRGERKRTVCLIPKSAHGTNPASAVMAGMEVVVVACDEMGNIDLQDLKTKAEQHKSNLSCLMQTYPSTHGVFEETMQEICAVVHQAGGQVYMDGANLNALVGLARPADLGADVCHINLHKTFCIPHGGGGPGMGPIGVARHLAPFLPNHGVVKMGGASAVGPVSAAPWGSAGILVIPWMYMAMTAGNGLKKATQIAILNANYIAKRLEKHFPVLYRGINGLVAHECILDLRQFKKSAGIEVEDVAKRLMDYGFHAPTVSFPVAGTLMVEPTESESKYELDRFCEAMLSIWREIKDIEEGQIDRVNNPLKNSPHPAEVAVTEKWDRPYTREKAVFPADYLRDYKFWPAVGRIDGVYGDRNLICTCPDIEAFQ